MARGACEVGGDGLFCDPRRSALDDGVGEDKEFSGAGYECNFMWFSGCGQTAIERHEVGVPAEGCWQSRGIQACSQPCAAVPDVACSDAIGAVVVEGSKSGERGSVLAGDAADLGHAHQNSDCGSQSDTVDADDQVEPFGQIAVLADCRCQGLEFAVQKPRGTGDFLLPELPDTWGTAGFAAGLATGDVLRDLLDHVRCSANGAKRGSGGTWIFSVAAVQAAIKPASILSFFARCRRNLA